MFSCEIYEIFKNMLFYGISPAAAPDNALCEEIIATSCLSHFANQWTETSFSYF